MKRITFSGWLLTVALLSLPLLAQDVRRPEPPMLGIHWARQAAKSHLGSQSVLMTWHGGDILVSTNTGAIFWGSSWPNYTGDKITGMETFYSGWNGSNYAKTSDEYTGINDQVTAANTFAGAWVDGSAAPRKAPSTSAVLNEVCSVLSAKGVAPATNGFYMVYSDQPRGHVSYCGWHSWGACGSTNIQFAFSFNLDNDPGCDAGDTFTGHSDGLANIANVTAHELSEARTDPRGNAWYDSSGAENGDKCAWTFPVDYVTFPGQGPTPSANWRLQAEWSNAVYPNGYPNLNGQNGCLSGQ